MFVVVLVAVLVVVVGLVVLVDVGAVRSVEIVPTMRGQRLGEFVALSTHFYMSVIVCLI